MDIVLRKKSVRLNNDGFSKLKFLTLSIRLEQHG